MVQIAYRNRELTSYPKINHVFVSSKAVFTAEALSSQYQAAITLCKQSYVDTQYTIKIHNIEINPLAINLDVSGCSGANNKAQIKVKTHHPPCRFSLLSIQWYAISGFDERGDLGPNCWYFVLVLFQSTSANKIDSEHIRDHTK